jgi:hypothetical protein
MATRPTDKQIAAFIQKHGLQANPVERITRHRDGSATLWLVCLGQPLEMPAPRRRRRSAKEKPSEAQPEN